MKPARLWWKQNEASPCHPAPSARGQDLLAVLTYADTS